MDIAAFELGEQLNNRKVKYVLHRDLWGKFDYSGIDLRFANWQVIKYLNNDASDFSDQINDVPNKSGGLYLYFVKCPILIGITEYPLYIGRAQYTDTQNLRKRVKEYFQKFSKDDERPKIYRMFKYWAKELYLAYYPLDENDSIVNLERDIINSLLLPMNDAIPDKQTRDAIKAF